MRSSPAERTYQDADTVRAWYEVRLYNSPQALRPFPASTPLVGIIETMVSVHRTIRWLVTTGLIGSLACAGLVSQRTVMAEIGTRAAVPAQPVTCCCGTENGRCCGMGCCMNRQSPAKDSPPCPNRQDTRGGRNNLQVVSLSQQLCSAGGETRVSRFAHLEADVRCPLSESSLQAKHVRIDA